MNSDKLSEFPEQQIIEKHQYIQNSMLCGIDAVRMERIRKRWETWKEVELGRRLRSGEERNKRRNQLKLPTKNKGKIVFSSDSL